MCPHGMWADRPYCFGTDPKIKLTCRFFPWSQVRAVHRLSFFHGRKGKPKEVFSLEYVLRVGGSSGCEERVAGVLANLLVGWGIYGHGKVSMGDHGV